MQRLLQRGGPFDDRSGQPAELLRTLTRLSGLLPGVRPTVPPLPQIIAAPKSGRVDRFLEAGIFGQSHIGGRRTQQDSFFVGGTMVAVADGMGGPPGGDWASSFAITDIALRNASGLPLYEAIEAANESMVKNRPMGLESAGTTFSALELDENSITVYTVGDSPIYRLREGRLELLAPPHKSFLSVDQEQLSQELRADAMINPLLFKLAEENPPYGPGIIKALFDFNSLIYSKELDWTLKLLLPLAHLLANALGGNYCKFIGSYSYPRQKGDLFLVCSDGVCLPPKRIGEILSEPTHIALMVDSLINESYRFSRGISDNITAIVVRG